MTAKGDGMRIVEKKMQYLSIKKALKLISNKGKRVGKGEGKKLNLFQYWLQIIEHSFSFFTPTSSFFCRCLSSAFLINCIADANKIKNIFFFYNLSLQSFWCPNDFFKSSNIFYTYNFKLSKNFYIDNFKLSKILYIHI